MIADCRQCSLRNRRFYLPKLTVKVDFSLLRAQFLAHLLGGLLCCALLFVRVAEAQELDAGTVSDGGEDDGAIEVVVTSGRTDEPARNTVTATQVITRAQIEQSGARNLADLLQNQPALQVRESFRGTELWLRGLDPQYTLILIDGERIPGRVDGAIDLSRFGIERVERVEIVRGPSSALYGSEAIAGVVNIIARESKRPLEGDALLSYGSRNQLDATGFVAGRPHDTLRLSATGGYHQVDAFRMRGDQGAATSGSARDQWSAGGTARFDPSRRHRLTLAGDYTRLSLTGVDAGAGTALLDRHQLQEQTSTRIMQRYAPNERIRWENRASYGQYRSQYLLDQRGGTALDKYEENLEHLVQAGTLLRLTHREFLTTTVGIDALAQRLESPRLSSTGKRERIALFAQEDIAVFQRGARALRVVPGIRFDLDSQFGQQFSPKLSIRFDVNEQLVLRASYGRGFQAPSFQQLLLRFENPSVGYVVEGNPDLKAERSHGVDLSAEWTVNDWLALTAALFRNDLTDMIATVTLRDGGASGIIYSYQNLSSAWTMGGESALRVRVGSWLSAQGSYALTYGHDGENDRVLQNQARHRPTALLRLAQDDWGLSGVLRGSAEIGRRYFLDDDGDGDDELKKPGALWRVDMRLEQRIGKHAELFVGIDNLFDEYDRFTLLRPRTYYGGARGRY